MAKKKKMIVRLNNRFYDKNAVKEALEDFKEVCDGKIVSNRIEVELLPKEKIEHLQEEFCNYVLGLMKNKMLI